MKPSMWIWLAIVSLAFFVLGFWGSCEFNPLRHELWTTNSVTNFYSSTNDVSVTNKTVVTNIKTVVVTNVFGVDWSVTNGWTNIIRRATTNG